MSSPTEVRALVEATVCAFGRLDMLVTNAAAAAFAPVEAVDEALVQLGFALNVSGPIFATQPAVARFPDGKGRVINQRQLPRRHAHPGGRLGIRGQQVRARGAHASLGRRAGPQGRHGERCGSLGL